MKHTTPFKADQFDREIERIVPFYAQFYNQTLDLVKAFGMKHAKWLDTGCGTGQMIRMAAEVFPKYDFVLADPSAEMIRSAKKTLSGIRQVREYTLCNSENLEYRREFDVVTAIQCHHYLRKKEREKAVQTCFRALKQKGVFVVFENFAPQDALSRNIGLNRWKSYQKEQGRTAEEINEHIKRYGTEYFPITLSEHMQLLKESGFITVEIFWLSCMQAGIYAVKGALD